MEPWYKVASLRSEVREGRSFNPDEFAIHLEQVVAGTAPEDYSDPVQFFSRTCFTRALREHSAMALRRLAGETANTAPVLTLVTQFGGGKTHTLAALYHMAKAGPKAIEYPGVAALLKEAGITWIKGVKAAAFVGNAWDPQPGRETPWIDIARQLAGDEGVRALGKDSGTVPPGTEALGRVFDAAGGPVLLLFDEVLNFLNRHRGMSDQFHSFIQNLTVATTGRTGIVAIISLPRSQVEMTDWDMQWQEKITKVVHRVSKDLIANDETEISEVVRRRLFEDLGPERGRKNIAKAYADWCFDRRAQLPPEWTAVDTASTEAKAREFLQGRFEQCYPFHPATLSVFQRKWQALAQYQQTRGTLAMLAQWVSWAFREGHIKARREPLITLGSAPLEVPEFRSIVLGQLGEPRLVAAIDADISAPNSHARALDADTKGALQGIHQRVATAILFESSGGQVDKVAHLPELRFALGEPEIDTTSIDNAAFTLEDKSYFVRKIGTDGFRIGHQATMKKVVNDRRASLDEETEIKPAVRQIVQKEFEKGAGVGLSFFPPEGGAVPDAPKLILVVGDPDWEWGGEALRGQITGWIKLRGKAPRLYPASPIWCLRKPGRDLHDKVELFLAWKRVEREVNEGLLGSDFERADRADLHSRVAEAESAAKDEVWGAYRFVVLYDAKAEDSLKVIDLGAGHSSSGESLSGRVISSLKSEALLNDSVGAGYIDRNWPPAFKESGAWPLASLRQSFLNGTLTRLPDPDAVLRQKIGGFVTSGDFGTASGQSAAGGYTRVWYQEMLPPDEITFDPGFFLLTKRRAEELTTLPCPQPEPGSVSVPPSGQPKPSAQETPGISAMPASPEALRTIRLSGKISSDVWNKVGIKLIPKLKAGSDLRVSIDIAVEIPADRTQDMLAELEQILKELGLWDQVSLD